jgi:hypothetical protein
MSALKSGLISIAVASLVATMAVVGCSADGASEGIGLATDQDPNEAKLPEKGTDPPVTDAGKPPSTSKDATVDTYVPPPPPNPGDPCTTIDEKKTKMCGKCGKAETICQSLDGGPPTWQAYGPCTNEMGICTPGTTRECGNCGTETCNNTCNWGGACAGQPMNSCPAGQIEYTQAGCSGLTYKNRTCSAACQWGQFTTVCAAPNNPNKLNASLTVNGTVTGNWPLTTSRMGKRSPTFCGSSVAAASDYPYVEVQVNNPHATLTMTATAWISGTPAIDTVIAVYPTILPPSTDNELKACTMANDQCSSSTIPGCTSPWSGLKGFTIPPGGAVLLRYSSYYANSNTFGDTTTGPVTLTVKTDSLQ